MAKGIVSLLFALAALFSANELGQHTYSLYLKGKESEDWRSATATFTHFDLRRIPGQRQIQNPHFDVIYHYEVSGTQFTGERVSFGPYDQGELVRPRNGQATVYYDPADPSRSTYIRGATDSNFYGLLFSIALGLAGIALACLGFVKIFRSL